VRDVSIRPVDFNGMMQMTQDVSNIKQQEDNRPALNQQNIGVVFEKQTDKQLKKVRDPQKTDQQEFRYDAKEKGSNSYSRQQKGKKKQPEQEKKVSVKEEHSGFDVKI
jgi:hypothetical protein